MKFEFIAMVTVTVSTTVFASTEEEARRIAAARWLGSVHPSHTEAHKDEWVCEDLDGSIKGITLENVSEGEGEDEEDE